MDRINLEGRDCQGEDTSMDSCWCSCPRTDWGGSRNHPFPFRLSVCHCTPALFVAWYFTWLHISLCSGCRRSDVSAVGRYFVCKFAGWKWRCTVLLNTWCAYWIHLSRIHLSLPIQQGELRVPSDAVWPAALLSSATFMSCKYPAPAMVAHIHAHILLAFRQFRRNFLPRGLQRDQSVCGSFTGALDANHMQHCSCSRVGWNLIRTEGAACQLFLILSALSSHVVVLALAASTSRI